MRHASAFSMAVTCALLLGGCRGYCAELDAKLHADLGPQYAEFEAAGGMTAFVPKAPVTRVKEYLRELVFPQREQLCELWEAPENYSRFTLPNARYLAAFHRDPATAGSRPSATAPRFESTLGSAAYAIMPLFVLGMFAYSFVVRRRLMRQQK